ncbi:LysR family transcriptional regulator [Bradyrhizobium jicamae]|uniref:LysR family transcriptional regulator n=1 Tax=Bradyrhizobium jicamae TaxID=280332 RepID=A0ABS5FL05_9BRAD|nr:LysR family transcriptional regulator [Bradyrhizobium jicamae]MBR0797464.1 LysR family transcriptional regulator [Bradyrhizobium jicamae]
MFDWDDLRHFLAVARQGSTIAAAKSLRLSQSTVHRRLAELEKRIGRHIVVRHATGYRLTEFGAELRPLVEQVEKAVGAIERYLAAADEKPGAVRVTCSESIGYRLVQTRLLETFQDRHPGMRVELVMSDHFLDIAKGEADVAIRAGIPNEETLVGRKIADVPWALYGSRAYLERNGRITGIEDLATHAVIGFDGDIKDHHAAKWLRSVAPSARVVASSDTVPGLLMSVKSGAGLAPLPMPLAAREVDLERVLGPLPVLYSPIYLLTHPDLRHVPRVSAFFDFIVTDIEQVRSVLTG